MGHRKARFHHVAIYFIKEAQLNGICGVAPDRKVGSTFGDGSAKGAGICRKHGGILPLNQKKYLLKRPVLR
jgi:hypothetical protein